MDGRLSGGQPEDDRRSRLIIAFAIVYIVWGSTYLAIRFAVATIPPFILGAARFILAGAILYVWASKGAEDRPTAPQWRDASITGLLLLCGGNGAVLWAEQRVPSGLTALLVAGVPLWMVLLDWARPRGVRPRPVVLVGITVGLCGLTLLIGPSALFGERDVDIVGALVLTAGSISWAAGSVYSRYSHHPRSAQMSTALQMLAGGAGFCVMALLLGDFARFDVRDVTVTSGLAWLYLVAIGGVVGFTAYIYLLKNTTPAKASTYAYVNPVVAVVLGWSIAGERISWQTMIAAAIILSGVAMINLSGMRFARRPGNANA